MRLFERKPKTEDLIEEVSEHLAEDHHEWCAGCDQADDTYQELVRRGIILRDLPTGEWIWDKAPAEEPRGGLLGRLFGGN